MPNEKQPLADGQTDFSGGMDASRSPELIGQNQISLGVNITLRENYPCTRPSFNRNLLSFAGDIEAEAWWNSNYFQGAEYFNTNGGYPSLIASVGGRIFNLQPQGAGFEVTDITPIMANGTIDRNSSILTKAYFCQADVYLIIQDGQSLPFIFDGSTVRRANPNIPEVPVGTIMAYGQGRLTVGFGDEFLVGDINGGATNVLSFTETTYLNGGGSFKLPMNMGNITGMIFTAQQDTNTGQGTLLVFGESGVISVNLSIPRTSWQDTQIVTVTLTDIGTLADRSIITINADIFFRSQDGIRTYRDARAEFGQYSLGNYGRTALSYEVSNYLSTDSLLYQPFTSGILFDNRYLMTTLPTLRNGIGVPVFQALTAMDFIPVSALRYNQPPVFDGLWTGLDFYQLASGQFSGNIRAFAFARGLDNSGQQELQLWEIGTQPGLDNGTCPVQCAFESKAFIFGSPLSYKRMSYLRHWANKIEGRVDWTLRIKPDQYPGWEVWQDWTDNAIVQTCLNTECVLTNYQPQYRAGRNSVMAPEGCLTDGADMKTYRTGFSFQIRLEWSGVARITKLLFAAMPQDIPKVNCLIAAPPDDPIASILKLVPSANQYFNELVSYTCPAGFTGTTVIVPAATFTSMISIADANAQALAYAMTQASCIPNTPVVTSGSINVGVSSPVSFQIVATSSPTSYGATGLPTGLSLNTSTGLITGTITSATITTYTVNISATNAGGTGHGTLTIHVKARLQLQFGGLATNDPSITTFMQISVDGGAYVDVGTSGTASYFATLSVDLRLKQSSYNFTVLAAAQSIRQSINLTAPDANVTIKSTSSVQSTISGVLNGTNYGELIVGFGTSGNITQYNDTVLPATSSPTSFSSAATLDAIINSGGPGGSGIQYGRFGGGALTASLAAHFDLTS